MDYQHWNHEWEKPDPLEGRRGWVAPRYISLFVLSLLLFFFFCWFVQVVRSSRQRQKDFKQSNQLVIQQFEAELEKLDESK